MIADTYILSPAVIEIHESKNFINAITQNPAPLRKKKKRQELSSLVNRSISDISLTEDGAVAMDIGNGDTAKTDITAGTGTSGGNNPAEKQKKRVSWAPAEALQSVKFFELDENERVNVNKVSMEEMKKKERLMERQHAAHKYVSEDNEDEAQAQKVSDLIGRCDID